MESAGVEEIWGFCPSRLMGVLFFWSARGRGGGSVYNIHTSTGFQCVGSEGENVG